jgi:hypothetical protein
VLNAVAVRRKNWGLSSLPTNAVSEVEADRSDHRSKVAMTLWVHTEYSIGRILCSNASTSKNLRAEFDKEEADRIATEKGRQKGAEAHRVADEALNQIFTCRLASYKKDHLPSHLALTMKAPTAFSYLTLKDISRLIQTYTRFSGLFKFNRASGRRKDQPNIPESMDTDGGYDDDDNADDNDKRDLLSQPAVVTQPAVAHILNRRPAAAINPPSLRHCFSVP